MSFLMRKWIFPTSDGSRPPAPRTRLPPQKSRCSIAHVKKPQKEQTPQPSWKIIRKFLQDLGLDTRCLTLNRLEQRALKANFKDDMHYQKENG